MMIFRRIFTLILFILTTTGLAARFLSFQSNPIVRNGNSLVVVKGLFKNPFLLEAVKSDLTALAKQDCHVNWLLGVVSESLGDQDGKRTSWQRLMLCSRADLDLIIAGSYQDENMLRMIVSQNPSNPAALFALADVVNQHNSKEAASLYEQVVLNDPSNGLAWCSLGRLHNRDKQLNKAVDDFFNCCRNGDPGSNGCYNAGRMMEQLGDPQKAIEYYRLSQSQGALKRADELEKQIRP
jgi:tetratricopeptide (TPR) repeat protein